MKFILVSLKPWLLRKEKKGSGICTGDTAAIVALCCLDYGENVVSVETLISKCGYSSRVERNFSEKALQSKLKRGNEFRIVYGTAVLKLNWDMCILFRHWSCSRKLIRLFSYSTSGYQFFRQLLGMYFQKQQSGDYW